ncbi:MAG TPA: glycosyltransferase [Desulfomonilaceae bacterium]|nr:glycosyltransferase [Desulfomonilaceae bacterium]
MKHVRPGTMSSSTGEDRGFHVEDTRLRARLSGIQDRLGRQVKVAHVVTVRFGLDHHLNRRLRLLQTYGFHNTGISTDADSPYSKNRRANGNVYDYIEVSHLNRNMDPVSDARALLGFIKVFRENTFDIVNTYGPKPGVVARIAAGLAGVPIVTHTSFGLIFTDRTPFVRKAVLLCAEAFSSQFGDWVMSVNQDDIPLLRKMNVLGLNSQVSYLGNATDLNFFQSVHVSEADISAMRQRWGCDRATVAVVMAGRLVREKGCVEFVRAGQILKDRGRKCKFVLIGPTDDSKSDSVHPEMIPDHVHVAGFEPDMRTAFAASDIVVLPSHREGFPRVLVEACAMGKPIVTTDSRGCREAVDEGQNGLRVPIGDSETLAEAIDRFVLNPDMRAKASMKSRAKALAEFDDNKLVHRIATVYAGLLERKAVDSSDHNRFATRSGTSTVVRAEKSGLFLRGAGTSSIPVSGKSERSGSAAADPGKKCPLCHACADSRPIFWSHSSISKTEEIRMNWLLCAKCGTYYVSEIPDEDTYVKHLRTMDYGIPEKAEYYARQKEELHSWILNAILDAKPAAETVLDYGCSFGSFLKKASEAGITGYGIDANPLAVDHLRNNGVHVEQGFHISLARHFGVRFSAIVMNDVICYVPDPLETFQEAFDVLEPKGVLILRVSNKFEWLKFLLRIPGLRRKAIESCCYDHFHVTSVAAYEGAVRRSGFEGISILPRALASEHGELSWCGRLAYGAAKIATFVNSEETRLSPGVVISAVKGG